MSNNGNGYFVPPNNHNNYPVARFGRDTKHEKLVIPDTLEDCIAKRDELQAAILQVDEQIGDETRRYYYDSVDDYEAWKHRANRKREYLVKDVTVLNRAIEAKQPAPTPTPSASKLGSTEDELLKIRLGLMKLLGRTEAVLREHFGHEFDEE